MLKEHHHGAGFALAAYLFWGVAPIYFVWVKFAAPLEILAQRIVWSIPLLLVLITVTGGWAGLRRLAAGQYLRLLACSFLLSVNWLSFIYAIHIGQIAETSLGYFINPLLSILLGRFFLGENMRRFQWLAAGLAGLGIAVEIVGLGKLPVYGLILAFSFGFYGLIRKQVAAPAPLALGIETTMVVPFALVYLFYWQSPESSHTLSQYGLLAVGGLVTVIPLVCFGAAAARMPLTQLGFFQYIAPSMSLLIAVFVYQETIPTARWINLVLIWLALAIFSAEAFYHQRRGKN